MNGMVRCHNCLEVNSVKDWNEATEKVFGPSSEPLENIIGKGAKEEFWYICPACKEQTDISELELEEDPEANETKKVRFSVRGSIEMEVFYDIGIELEIPADMDHNDVEDYIESDPQLKEKLDKEWNKGIQKIHDKLKAVELEYEENGGQNEPWVDEI